MEGLTQLKKLETTLSRFNIVIFDSNFKMEAVQAALDEARKFKCSTLLINFTVLENILL